MAGLEFPKDEDQADAVAAAVSSLCLLHCLAMPLIFAFSPAVLGLQSGVSHGPPWLHWALLGMAVPASLHALRKGFAVHGNSLPWKVAVLGFALVAAGAVAHGLGPIEQMLTLAGGAVIAAAHWRNWRSRPAG